MIHNLSRNLLLVATALSAVGCQSGSANKAMNARLQQAQMGAGVATLRRMAQEAAAHEQRQVSIAMLEQMVRASPQDLVARQQLAGAYFGVGRFKAAAEAYLDVLAMSPNDEAMRLKRVLALLAQGDQPTALAELGTMRASQDVGLAYALAGETKRGIDLLDQAVREPNATARTRQNLALAYALDGQWARARAVAAQDLDPAMLEARVRQWAELASTANSAMQTAWLVSVAPAAEDAGRPVALAYTPPIQSQPVAVAAAEAAAQPIPETVADRVPERIQVPPVAVVRASAESSLQPYAQGQWVVQLGAYATADLLETNWQQISRRNKVLQAFEVVRIEAQVGQQVFHRLAVSGFDSRAAANSLCRTLQTKGRDCFVRNIGDTPPVQVARLSEPTRA